MPNIDPTTTSAIFDPTITLTVVIAICAIISPVITTAMNLHHQTKLKQIESHKQHYEETVLYKRTIFENYLKHAGHCIATNNSSKYWSEYNECYFLALIYASEKLKSEMKIAHNLLENGDYDLATNKLCLIATEINKLLQNM